MPKGKHILLSIFAIMGKASVYLVLLSLILLFGACGGERKVEGSFTEEELSWLVYKDGENLLFQNPDSIGDEVTLFISSQKDPAKLRSYYPIEAEVTVSNPEQGDYFKIYLLKDERDFKRYLKFGDVYLSFDLVVPLKELKIGDTTYPEVYVFKEDSTFADSFITEVYFATGHGVVQYFTKDGRSFVLFNNELVERH